METKKNMKLMKIEIVIIALIIWLQITTLITTKIYFNESKYLLATTLNIYFTN